jgi:hypothetical protein
LWITVCSVVIGVATHLLLDGLTHQRRWGPRLLGYQHVELTLLGHRLGLAPWLQLLGHTVGSALAVLMLWHIGRRRLLDEWYGAEVVAEVRSFRVTPRQRADFWMVVVAGLVVGSMWGMHGDRVEQILRPIVAMAGAAAINRGLASLRERTEPRSV